MNCTTNDICNNFCLDSCTDHLTFTFAIVLNNGNEYSLFYQNNATRKKEIFKQPFRGKLHAILCRNSLDSRRI